MDFNLITDLTQLIQPMIVLGCLCVGYVLKHWIQDVDNKYIPTILMCLGILLNLVVNGLTVNNAIMGAFMGLASTGLHQAFTKFVEGKDE